VSGTIHDHLLSWKVDVDIAGTNNSVRIDQVRPHATSPDLG
jgi:Cu2+-containing amine oxidase